MRDNRARNALQSMEISCRNDKVGFLWLSIMCFLIVFVLKMCSLFWKFDIIEIGFNWCALLTMINKLIWFCQCVFLLFLL